ncbi:MAG: GNAT family N-acetyltransferase [Maioricimonas sp. JB045]
MDVDAQPENEDVPRPRPQLTTNCGLLAEVPECLPTVAQWLHCEWYAARGMSPQETENLLTERMRRSRLPMCAVALRNGEAVGTASLLAYECPEVHADPRSVLADVFVPESQRGQGIASSLCRWMIDLAAAMGVEQLFVMTAGPPVLYKRLGWRTVQRNLPGPRGQKITLLVLDVGASRLEGAPGRRDVTHKIDVPPD